MNDTDGTRNSGEFPTAPSLGPGMMVGNSGKPILLTGFKIAGISAESAKPPDKVKVWTRLALTSDDQLFHRVVEQFGAIIADLAQQAGKWVNLKRADVILLVIKPDDSAELWVDTAALSLNVITKYPKAPGMAVFESDIADVVGMSFPLVEINPADRIFCLFREDWRFALFFDFNRNGLRSLEEVSKILANLYRNLKYRHLYDAVANENVMGQLFQAGWFPFVEIIGDEFQQFVNSCEAGFDLKDAETALVAKFTPEPRGVVFILRS